MSKCGGMGNNYGVRIKQLNKSIAANGSGCVVYAKIERGATDAGRFDNSMRIRACSFYYRRSV